MKDLARWELPADDEAATVMVESITQGIVDNGGIAGTSVGQTPEGPSANLNSVVAYVVAPVLDKPTVEIGIVYVFAAGFAFNAEKARGGGRRGAVGLASSPRWRSGLCLLRHPGAASGGS